MDIVLGIFVFFFGAIIGSFLNVVVLRYRSGRTLGGRSMCFSCGKTLTWFELVPLGSFLTQRGRCQGCKAPISWQYPLVEATTGVLFVFLYYRLAYLVPGAPILFAVLFTYYAVLISLLIVLSVYDLRHKILPDQLTIIFTSIAFISMFLISGDAIVLHLPRFSQFAAGILLPAPFTMLWYFSKGKWMGLGDSKLMIGIGFLLGLSGGVAALFLSFWIGAAISLILLFIGPLMGKKRLTFHSAIPFGPFLALGTIVVMLSGMTIWTLVTSVGTLFVR